MNYTDIEDKEAARKRKLHSQLNSKTQLYTQLEKTKIYWIKEWFKHPINQFKRWLILTFPNHFKVGE